MTTKEPCGCVCGTCLAHISASHVPDLCFGCGSRYDRAPYALLSMSIEGGGTGRGTVSITPRFHVEFYGLWDIESRAAIVTAFGG